MSGDFGLSGFLDHSEILLLRERVIPPSSLGGTSVKRSSSGPVTWFAVTHCHDASVLKPLTKQNKTKQNKSKQNKKKVRRLQGLVFFFFHFSR